jgi:nucleoside 2-deoxyribosyltransferase
MQRADAAPPEVKESLLPSVHDLPPSPAEQADNLVRLIGNRQPSPAECITIPEPEVSSSIGMAIGNEGLFWLLRQPQVDRLVENHASQSGPDRLLLTFEGWQRYEALKRADVESRKAFMAMKFGDDELNRAVNEYFKPAVARTGFELRLVTDRQHAGLIDDQLRVALRGARFVIADLTHANNGAYWEAGFAEGLGRPVIYTCQRSAWENQKTHFDTNHLATIIWDPENLADAESRLAAMIRATLPAEAKMTD